MDRVVSLGRIGITSNCTVTFFSRLRGVGLVRTCLGSGRVQIASRSVAGQCETNAIGVVHLVKLTLLLGMTKKGKVPTVPPTTRSRPHVVPPRGAGAGVGNSALLTPLDVMTKEDFSKYETKEEKKKLGEEEHWRQCQREENRCILSKSRSMSTIWSSKR